MEAPTIEQSLNMLPGLEALAKSGRSSVGDIANLSSIYFTLGMPEKCLPLSQMCYDAAPGDALISLNHGMLLKDLGRHAESVLACQHAYMLQDQEPYIQLAYAEGLLRAGFWRQAWPIYDKCRPTQAGAAKYLGLPAEIKEWAGENDGTVLLINEGGTGDRLSYARWLPELSERGIDWRFYPFTELMSFYQRVLPPERLIKDGDQIVAKYWTTPFSLPAKLNVIPAEIPPPLNYSADGQHITKFKIQRTDKLPIVGLVWRAAELFQGGRTVRSLTEAQAMRLVCWTHDKANWVNLVWGAHQGKRLPAPVENIEFITWSDTAGLIATLDAIVTVDTGTFHLAAAMGKPCILLLSANSDWKYLMSGNTQWYPDVKVYRNKGYGFEDAISRLIGDIRKGLFEWDKL